MWGMASNGLSRRLLFGRAAAVSAGTVLATPAVQTLAEATEPAGDELVTITLTVNGERRQLRIDPRVTLLDAMRERMNLTGTKKGCDHGQCGACTVHVDGRRVVSCLTLAASVNGRAVTTIEGLAGPDNSLHPLQKAFHEKHALQCGFCTPGMIMAAVDLLADNPDPDDTQIREGLEGNLCRCTGYQNIVRAVRRAAGDMRQPGDRTESAEREAAT